MTTGKMVCVAVAAVLAGSGFTMAALPSDVAVADWQQGKDRADKGAAPAGKAQQGGKGGQEGKAQSGKSQQAGKSQGGKSSAGQAGKAQGQGRGQGREGQGREGQGRPAQGGGASWRDGNAHGKLSRAEVDARMKELSAPLQKLNRSARTSDRMVVNAAARGVARGMRADELGVNLAGNKVHVTNRRGELLFDMDEDRARSLGAWDLRRLGDRRPTGNAPAFCRSGEGHPVWGREWCLDKGFGLGSSNGMIWSRTSVEDILLRRRVESDRYDRGGLIDVLGDVVFGRLALHALTLGFTDPLVGVYVAEPNAPRVLRLSSGTYQVAELVDLDRDDRVDVLYVTQWQ